MCTHDDLKENGVNGSEIEPTVENMVSTEKAFKNPTIHVQYLTDQVKSLEKRNAALAKDRNMAKCFATKHGLYKEFNDMPFTVELADWGKIWNEEYAGLAMEQLNGAKSPKTKLDSELSGRMQEMAGLVENYFTYNETEGIEAITEILTSYLSEFTPDTKLSTVMNEVYQVNNIVSLLCKLQRSNDHIRMTKESLENQ